MKKKMSKKVERKGKFYLQLEVKYVKIWVI